jgi:hypothetical protein
LPAQQRQWTRATGRRAYLWDDALALCTAFTFFVVWQAAIMGTGRQLTQPDRSTIPAKGRFVGLSSFEQTG